MNHARHLAALALCCAALQANAAASYAEIISDASQPATMFVGDGDDLDLAGNTPVWRVDPHEWRAVAVADGGGLAATRLKNGIAPSDGSGWSNAEHAIAAATAIASACAYTGTIPENSWRARSGPGDGWYGRHAWHDGWRWGDDYGRRSHHGGGTSPIPEPSGIVLMLLGLSVLGIGWTTRMSRS